MVDKAQSVPGVQRLAEKASGLLCKYPEARALRETDKAHLHAFKHDVVAGIYRMYTLIDADTVDILLRKFFATVIDVEMNRDEEAI